MTKQEFRTLLTKEKFIILDGATGSNLQKRGMPSGICAEKWIAEHEHAIIELQREYIEAGSQIIYAPTFSANRIKLKEYGLEAETVDLNKNLVEISKKAAGANAYVAGDLTMCGQQLKPLGALSMEELIAAYEQQICAVEQAGVDLIVVETMMSLQETRAALIAAGNVSALPVMATMSFGADGRTLYGTDVKTAAVVLEGLGADAVGVNCSAGPDKMLPLLEQIKEASNLPIIAKPNAGMPKLSADGTTIYDMDAQSFAENMRLIAGAGAVLLGGCCGTSPDYIKKTKEMLPSCIERQETKLEKYLATERSIHRLPKQPYLCCIDVRKNQELAQELTGLEMDSVYDCIDEMTDEDAVCVCVDGLANAKEALWQLIAEISGYAKKPLCFLSNESELLEYALLHYCGRTAVCSETLSQQALQEIARKYGAYALKDYLSD